MKLLLSCLVALSSFGSAFAGDAVIGQKIINADNYSTDASLAFNAAIWVNNTGSWIAVKKIEYILTDPNVEPGPYWVYDTRTNDVLVLSTVKGGATNDFSPDYVPVGPGDSLWAVIGSHVPTGISVVIWYTKISAPPM